MPDAPSTARLLKRSLAWLVVLIPAAWGVLHVVQKSAALFR
jgi:hypothetical protein